MEIFSGTENREAQTYSSKDGIQGRFLIQSIRPTQAYDSGEPINLSHTEITEAIANRRYPWNDIAAVSRVESNRFWNNRTTETTHDERLVVWEDNFYKSVSSSPKKVAFVQNLYGMSVNDIAKQAYSAYVYDTSNARLKGPETFKTAMLDKFPTHDEFIANKDQILWLAKTLYGKDVAGEIITQILELETKLDDTVLKAEVEDDLDANINGLPQDQATLLDDFKLALEESQSLYARQPAAANPRPLPPPPPPARVITQPPAAAAAAPTINPSLVNPTQQAPAAAPPGATAQPLPSFLNINSGSPAPSSAEAVALQKYGGFIPKEKITSNQEAVDNLNFVSNFLSERVKKLIAGELNQREETLVSEDILTILKQIDESGDIERTEYGRHYLIGLGFLGSAEIGIQAKIDLTRDYLIHHPEILAALTALADPGREKRKHSKQSAHYISHGIPNLILDLFNRCSIPLPDVLQKLEEENKLGKVRADLARLGRRGGQVFTTILDRTKPKQGVIVEPTPAVDTQKLDEIRNLSEGLTNPFLRREDKLKKIGTLLGQDPDEFAGLWEEKFFEPINEQIEEELKDNLTWIAKTIPEQSQIDRNSHERAHRSHEKVSDIAQQTLIASLRINKNRKTSLFNPKEKALVNNIKELMKSNTANLSDEYLNQLAQYFLQIFGQAEAREVLDNAESDTLTTEMYIRATMVLGEYIQKQP